MRKWLVSGIISAMGAVFVLSSFASAAPAPSGAATGGTSGQGLEISPPVIELAADPGQTVTATIRVRNVTSGQLIAKGRADDFGAGKDENGQPKLLLDETGATRFSLKYWVQGVPDLRLAPQELKTTTITIKVPKNAEPGGHFGVVRFTALPPNLDGTGVALSASVGSLVLLRVSGQVTDKVDLKQFSIAQSNRISSFFEHGPLNFIVRLQNQGSVHERVQGSIEVTNMFGKKLDTVMVNPKGGNVLPDSIRRFEQILPQKALFGRYTAKLKLSYLDGKKTINGNLTFWVIPWKLVLLALVGLLVFIWLLRLAIRRYNQHIIAVARRR